MTPRTTVERKLAEALGAVATGWLRLCLRRVDWLSEGEEELRAATARGPVIVVLWHSRVLLGPPHLTRIGRGTWLALHDRSPAGRFGASIQRRFGMRCMPMSAKRDNRRTSREVMAALKQGANIAIASDGPLGPAQVMGRAAIDWARVSGAPVFLYASSVRAQRRLPTWDRMMFPLPWGRGAYSFRRWTGEVPRRMGEEETEHWRSELGSALTAHQAEVDRMIGLPPGP